MKITPEIDKEILAKAAEGWSAPRIAEWLLASRQIKITRQAVANRLRKTRDERGAAVKAVTREVLAPQLRGDLGVLERERRRLTKLVTPLYRRTMKAADRGSAEELHDAADVFLKVEDRLAKVIDLKLHYAGADTEDAADGEAAQAGERIRSRLARLAEQAGAGDDPPGPGAGQDG